MSFHICAFNRDGIHGQKRLHEVSFARGWVVCKKLVHTGSGLAVEGPCGI